MLTRTTRRRVIAAAATGAVVIAAFVFVIPRIASYGSAWMVIKQLTWPWIAALGVATLINVATFALPWMVALPGLGFLKALAMTQASTAFSSLVPGGAPVGMAASFGILRSWGFGAKRVALAVTLTGVWNQISVFVFPIIAVGLLAAEGAGFGSLALLAFIGFALFIVIAGGIAAFLARPRLAFRVGELASLGAARLGRLRGKQPPTWGGDALVSFRSETLVLLRRRWFALTVSTLANQLTGYLMLELSLRAVGISRSEISVAESFAAWSVGRLLVSLPLTPGGVGVVEVGLVGALIGFGGTSADVVAAVLAYRALSLVPTLLLGLLASATWRLRTPSANPSHS
jgi:uncharacterized membrane protein YbhN (UPF0104 family)